MGSSRIVCDYKHLSANRKEADKRQSKVVGKKKLTQESDEDVKMLKKGEIRGQWDCCIVSRCYSVTSEQGDPQRFC